MKRLVATKLMSQVVLVPTLYERSVPKNVLAVVRPMEHSVEYGFSVKEGPFKLSNGTYATRYLDVTKSGEYRVWFCGNKTLCGRRYKMECNERKNIPAEVTGATIFVMEFPKIYTIKPFWLPEKLDWIVECRRFVL